MPEFQGSKYFGRSSILLTAMRPEYYNVYDRLFADYAYDFGRRGNGGLWYGRRFFPDREFELVRSIRRSIDRSDRSNQLRPDAKYFLLVNFHQLILAPLLEGEAMGVENSVNFGEGLEVDIQADIGQIIEAALNDRGRNDDAEISGHRIMQTIDRIWQQLRTTRFETWG